MSCGHMKCEQVQAVGTSGAGHSWDLQAGSGHSQVWETSNYVPGQLWASNLGVRGVGGQGLAAEPLPDMLQAVGPVPLHRLVLCAGAPCICRAGARPPLPRLAATGGLGSSACS